MLIIRKRISSVKRRENYFFYSKHCGRFQGWQRKSYLPFQIFFVFLLIIFKKLRNIRAFINKKMLANIKFICQKTKSSDFVKNKFYA